MQRSRHHGQPARWGVGLLTPILAVTLAAPAHAEGRQETRRPDVAVDWLEATITTASAAGPGLQGSRAAALGWLSAQRALTTDDRGAPAQRAPFEDAAVATAVHDTLAELVPTRRDSLDAALAASLAATPDGPGKQAGIRAGRRAAAQTQRERAEDGLDPASVNKPFPDPPVAPGVYRRPADALTPTVIAGLSQARPFRLDRADRFRPEPPPGLDTGTYRRDLDEVRRYGSKTSTVRTEWQTDTALLWGQDSWAAYTAALRPLIADRGRTLAWKVRLVAAFTTVTIDALIATADSKYAYLWWRPITAIRESGHDQAWTPLLPTPAHPEYAAGHPAFAGAAEQVLTRFVGARTPVPFTITATTGSGRVISREYRPGTPWSTLTQENIDARVWAGAHYRTSDETGATIGRRVAIYDLAHPN